MRHPQQRCASEILRRYLGPAQVLKHGQELLQQKQKGGPANPASPPVKPQTPKN
jgi:hypothetical protein